LSRLDRQIGAFCLVCVGRRSATAGRTPTQNALVRPTQFTPPHQTRQEAQLSPRDRAMRASCQLKSCQLPRNSAETTCKTSPDQIDVMNLEGYSWAMCNKHVHSTMTRPSRFHCPIGVINKPTTDELWISPVYRRLAVAKFSVHNVEIAHVTLTTPT